MLWSFLLVFRSNKDVSHSFDSTSISNSTKNNNCSSISDVRFVETNKGLKSIPSSLFCEMRICNGVL